MKIILDFDSTIAKTHEAVLALYREVTGDTSTEIDDKNLMWNMKDVCKEWTQEDVNSVFTNPRLFDFMQPMENAVEVLQRLHDEGHYLEICSLHRKAGIPFKEKWIKENLPMIDKITIIPFDKDKVSKVFDKSSVKGDVIVDDRIDALTTSTCKYKICYGDYSWNREWQGNRVLNWLDLYNALVSIDNAEKSPW